jgi:predicted metal-dependent peptidase
MMKTRTIDRETEQAVQEAISLVRRKLMIDFPFFAMPAMKLVAKAGAVDGWSLVTDGTTLVIDPSFLALSKKHQVFSVLHEVLHCVLLHMVRRGDRDRELWDAAADLVVNNVLDLCLDKSSVKPGGKIKEGIYELPPWCLFASSVGGRDVSGLSVEEVYELLKNESEQNGGGDSGDGGGFDRFRNDEGEEDAPTGSAPNVEPGREPGLDERDRGKGGPSCADQTKVEQVAARWRETASAMVEMCVSRGFVPAGMEQLIAAAAAPIISWRRRLAKHLTAIVRTGSNWSRPSRRWLGQDVYLPSRQTPSLGRILVAVDTSLSVSDEDVSQFLAEVNAISASRDCVLELASVDVAMTMVGTYGPKKPMPREVKMTGRGGTSFVEPFLWAGEQAKLGPSKRIRLVVYLTDGVGEYPDWPVSIPTLWVMNQAIVERYRPPFGEVVFLADA